jgi:O-antigen/teichoic acid export membrane protein
MKAVYFARLSIMKYSSELVVLFFSLFYSFLAANILGPEKYGLVSYLMAFVAGVPFLFGFEALLDYLKVFVARYKSKAIIKTTIISGSLLLLGFFVLTILFSSEIVKIAGKGTPELVVLFSALIFVMPLMMLTQAVFAGSKQFGKLFKLVIFEKLSEIILLIFFLFVLKLDYLSMFFSTLMSFSLVCLISLYRVSKIKFDEKAVASKKESFYFLKGSWISNLIKGFSNQAEVWVFGFTLNLFDFGVFYLVKRITTYVYESPQMALSDVILPFLSEESSKTKLEEYTSKVLKFQFLLNLAVSVFFVTLVPVLLFVFFPKYVTDYFVFPLLAIGLAFNLSYPIARLLRAVNKNYFVSIAHLAYIISCLIFGLILIPAYGILGAAFCLAASKVVVFISFFALATHLGYKIDFIPRISDIQFFANSLFALLLSIKKSLFSLF